MARRTLGKNLAALLGSAAVKTDNSDVTIAPATVKMSNAEIITPWREIAIHEIFPGSMQPRRHIDEENLQALAVSIRAQGIIQPLVVRAKKNGYELIAGERRWRAAQIAELKVVPAIVRQDDEKTATVIALIENIQREDLNVLDQGEAVFRLIHEFNLTHQQIGDELGMSRTAVSNLLRLLNLPEAIKKYLLAGSLEMGHARALLSLPTLEVQMEAADIIMARQLSVRQAESLVKKLQVSQNNPARNIQNALEIVKTLEFSEIEQQLELIGKTIGLKYQLKAKKRGGKLVLAYKNLEQLKLVLQKLAIS